MKVAITVQGKSLSDPLDPRFGRAHTFLVVDTETDHMELLDNKVNLEAAQGAGIQSAQRVAQSGATAVITGHVGPKAFAALSAAGIAVYLAGPGATAEALARFRRGELSKQSAADMESHW